MVHTVEQRRLHRYRLRINISYTSRQFVKANSRVCPYIPGQGLKYASSIYELVFDW